MTRFSAGVLPGTRRTLDMTNGRVRLQKSVLSRRGYTMVIVANGERTERATSSFAALSDRCRKDGVAVVSVSSGGNAPVDAPHYLMDRTELRQLLRADNGAVLLRGGRIIGKWNMLTMPLASAKSITASAAVQTMILPLFLLGHLAFALVLIRAGRRARKRMLSVWLQ